MKSGSFKILVNGQSNGRCPMWVCYTMPQDMTAWIASGCHLVDIYIPAWASALLVSDYRAMPEPHDVGRADECSSHAFLFLFLSPFIIHSLNGNKRHKSNSHYVVNNFTSCHQQPMPYSIFNGIALNIIFLR